MATLIFQAWVFVYVCAHFCLFWRKVRASLWDHIASIWNIYTLSIDYHDCQKLNDIEKFVSGTNKMSITKLPFDSKHGPVKVPREMKFWTLELAITARSLLKYVQNGHHNMQKFKVHHMNFFSFTYMHSGTCLSRISAPLRLILPFVYGNSMDPISVSVHGPCTILVVFGEW